MDPGPYLRYLEEKLGEIYGLPVEAGATAYRLLPSRELSREACASSFACAFSASSRVRWAFARVRSWRSRISSRSAFVSFLFAIVSQE